ncbi:uncharacterized protein LOC141852086 isoform X2 [Brevipalpus obovatus]|uniref:uncharacterized protein LOC141852086 isoform X2 n=1 Tax=Brevipalpus obovatus TaxID=246614 RepID=UPI003D9F057D
MISKGVLPIPLPLPLPLPIEWEQPPIIVTPKHNHVPVPHPIMMPSYTPVHVPVYQYQREYSMSDYNHNSGSYTSAVQNNVLMLLLFQLIMVIMRIMNNERISCTIDFRDFPGWNNNSNGRFKQYHTFQT